MGLFQAADPGGRQPATKPATTDDEVSASIANALNPASLPSNPIASLDRLQATLSTRGASIGTNLPSSALPTPQPVPPASAIHAEATPWQVAVDVPTQLGRDGRAPGGDQPVVKPIGAPVGQPAPTPTGVPDLPHEEPAPPQIGLARLPRAIRSRSVKTLASSLTPHSPTDPGTSAKINAGVAGNGVETHPSNVAPQPQLHTEGEFTPVTGQDRPQAATSSQALGLPPQLHSEGDLALVTDEGRPQAATCGLPLGFVPQAPEANVPRGHSKRNPAPIPPSPSGGLNIPSPMLSTVSSPVQAESAVAGPSTAVATEPRGRTAEPGAVAQPPSMSSLRALGNAPGERAARQFGDSPVPPESPGSALGPQVDSYEQASARVNGNQAETTELAFGGRLVPVVPTEEPAHTDRTDLRPSLADKASRFGSLSSIPGSPDPVGEKAVTAVQATGLNTSYTSYREGRAVPGVEEGVAAPSERERKLAASRSTDGEPATAAARTVSEPPRLSQESAPGGAVRPKGDPAPPEPASARFESEAPKTPAATRDIKLEVGSGDQRVELHLTERAGDVHVAVRTPDTHLAGELRENLPDLSSRLERTGLRPEEWHTTTVSGEWHREGHSTGASSNDANGQPRQDTRERQGDPESRQPKAFEEQPNRKEKGKDFQWFMSSLH